MDRSLIYAANWKMNHGPTEARRYAERFLSLTSPAKGRSLWFFPPSVSLSAVCDTIRGRADIRVGVQNVHWEAKGAFTGEVSIPIAMEAGARAVLAGHSERRQLFGETDEYVARKTKAALNLGVTPLVCVGETLAERDSGQTEAVVKRQLAAVIHTLGHCCGEMVVAYEPVWAIGTGLTATPAEAQAVHAVLRAQLHAATDKSGVMRVLYGGSVKADNAAELFSQPDIDGGLIGGASLKVADFAAICLAAAH